ncbi:MAG: ATP-dependent helicase [Acidimicrobiales bacterium]
MITEEKLLVGLNPAQREAVLHRGSPLLVVAGAGSGKTRVLTSRIAHLMIEDEVRPSSVLAITFTNKAASEMRTRLVGMLGDEVGHMWMSTFHSACVRILRTSADRLGFSRSFTIYDTQDSRRLIEQIEKDLNMDPKKIRPQAIMREIGAAKAELIDFESYRERKSGPFGDRVADVYGEYQHRLQKFSAMDFDDLLMVTVNLFEACPDVLDSYRERFRHILVDEYQDTNPVQNRLVLMLGDVHRNVCVVGDADQSIYMFRGADIRNILEFEKAFPDVKVITLEQNYRSTKSILDAANAVISNNYSRIPKDLWTAEDEGPPVFRYRADDENDEARFVGREIRRLAEQEGLFYSDMAVFYRTNAQSRAVEEALVVAGIPYKVIGATRFYDRREVKDLLAYLMVVANPADEVSARRIVNVPRRGIGDVTLAKLAGYATASGRTLVECLACGEDAGVGKKAVQSLGELSELLSDLVKMNENGAGPASLVTEVLERTGYREAIKALGGQEAQSRLENIAELVSVASRFVELQDMLSSVALVSGADDLYGIEGKVSLMTIHIAKGLEFEAVFMVGMDDGIFPHLRSLDDPVQLEEERRLCYVGITRSKRWLYLTHAWERTIWGASSSSIPSRFFSEIPEELVRDLSAPQIARTRIVRSRLA